MPLLSPPQNLEGKLRAWANQLVQSLFTKSVPMVKLSSNELNMPIVTVQVQAQSGLDFKAVHMLYLYARGNDGLVCNMPNYAVLDGEVLNTDVGSGLWVETDALGKFRVQFDGSAQSFQLSATYLGLKNTLNVRVS